MSTWLQKLRSTELHRLAVLLGTPCSGTKAVRLEGIENALKTTREAGLSRENRYQRQDNNVIRLLSIDMGVKNLAYAYFTTPPAEQATTAGKSSRLPALPRIVLEEWQKFDISGPASTGPGPAGGGGGCGSHDLGMQSTESAHAYHPKLYASRAYGFVQSILRHDPTHIIVERQRFRSAGGPAVQEWSIRVGVFEAMIWAVLTTMMEHSNTVREPTSRVSCEVEGVLPARVNQFWFDRHLVGSLETGESKGQAKGKEERNAGKAAKLSGKDMKRAKINLAASMLEGRNTGRSPVFEIGESELVQGQVDAFLHTYGSGRAVGAKDPAGKSSSRLLAAGDIPLSRINKLDDLADCFMQGLAWLNWRSNREKVVEHGQDAFDLTCGGN